MSESADQSQADDLLSRIERSIYDEEPMSDEELEAECRLWVKTFPQLRHGLDCFVILLKNTCDIKQTGVSSNSLLICFDKA